MIERQPELEALDRLGWSAHDLWVATFGYGDVGTFADLTQHLASGNHLGPAAVACIAAALNDALLDQDDPFRLG